jgi:hypothetical protein
MKWTTNNYRVTGDYFARDFIPGIGNWRCLHQGCTGGDFTARQFLIAALSFPGERPAELQ